MASTLVIVITIVSASKSLSTPEFVFTKYHNETGMGSPVYVCLIGLLLSSYGFSGYEAGAHMAEETKNASSSAPKGILYTCIATAITGFAYIIGLLFACQGNIDGALRGPNEHPVVNIYQMAFTGANGSHNKHGSLAMTSLLIINLFFAGFSSLTVTSRIGFAIARDGGLPCSKFFYKVNPKTKTPDRVIVLVFIFDTILCLMPLVSTTAFVAITSITTIGY